MSSVALSQSSDSLLCSADGDWEVLVTHGNVRIFYHHILPFWFLADSFIANQTDAMDNILRTLCARGDSVLVEEYAYPGMSSLPHM